MKKILTLVFLLGLINQVKPQEIERLYVTDSKKEVIVRRTLKKVLYFKSEKDTFFLGAYSDSIPSKTTMTICMKSPKNYDRSKDHIVIHFEDGTCITLYRQGLPTSENYSTYIVTFIDMVFLETKKIKKISFDEKHEYKVKTKGYFIKFIKKIKPN